MLNKSKVYEQNGLFLSKQRISKGDEIIIGYKGLLLTSGASQVYMHVGYGENWDYCEDIPMIFSDGMFKVKLKVREEGQLGIAFKDPAENWDNNSGQNYCFKVVKKASRVSKEKTETKKEVKATKPRTQKVKK